MMGSGVVPAHEGTDEEGLRRKNTLAALFHINTNQHVRLLTGRPLSQKNTGLDPQTGFA
jgi:hypothetical protein